MLNLSTPTVVKIDNNTLIIPHPAKAGITGAKQLINTSKIPLP